MKRIRWLAIVVLAALPLLLGGRGTASATPDCVNGPGGLAAYYFDGSKGTLNLSNGQPWVITLTDIDGSAVTGNQVYHLLVQDHGTGSGWETLPTQTHHGFYGAGGHLLQSDDKDWTVRSSHGFNPGDVSGTYDLRVVMSQRSDDKWDISPYFRLPGGNWTLFYDGTWTTATAFDLTQTRVAVGIDAGGDGTLCFTAPTANAVELTNVFVDDDWVGLPNGEEVLFPGDPNPHYIGLDAFAAIQDGIDNVAGSTINVAAGTYTEAATLPVGADLTIQGAGRDVTTWIAPADDPSRMHCLECQLQGYTGTTTLDISGFTFSVEDNTTSNSGIAILCNHAEQGPLYLSVHDNKFVETTTIADETANSMLLCHDRFAARSPDAPVKIYNNLDETTGGITMSNTRAFDIYDNTFDGGSDALYIGYGCPENTTIGDHHIYNNTFRNASSVYPGGPWPSILFSYYGSGTGMTFLPSTIENNFFEDNDAAIGYQMDSDITYPADVIRDNSFEDSNEYAVQVSGAYATTVDATGNWWGSDTGPTHGLNPGGAGDAVSDNVAYSPWLGIGTDTSGDPGFQPASPMTYIVGPDVCLALGCIQQAVNLASDGDTFRVKEGIYTEQVVVDGKNNLTIEDFGSPKPKVTVGPDARAPIIHVKNSSNVTVDGLEIDGAGNGASPCPPGGGPDTDQRFYGIRYSNSSGTVSDNEVHGIRYPTVCGSTVGVYAYQSSVEISGNTVYDFDKNGITANLAGSSTIEGNTVTGWGPSGAVAQNGIQIGFGATGTVEGNTVSDIYYTGDCWAGSGILVTSYAVWGYPPSSADVTGNTVSDAQVGIYYGEGSGEASGNTVSASAAGVGVPKFWGIIISDPADHAPSPFEEGAAPPAGGDVASTSAGVMNVVVSGSTLTGDGSAGSVGLEVSAGYGPEDVVLTASGNSVSNWGNGILVTKCTEDCDTGVLSSVVLGPDNEISGNDNGVFLDSVSGVIVSGNEIDHSLNRQGYAGAGVMLWGDNDNNHILNNVIHDNDRQGIFVGHDTLVSTGNIVSGNTIYDNGLYTNPNGPDASAYGIELWSADNNDITNNEVYGHDDWFYYPGFDFAQGIYLYESNDNVVTGNDLHHNNYGVGLWGPGRGDGTNLINFNSIAANTGFGVINYDALTVNAESNWWGACDGPSGAGPGSGDAVSAMVDFEPWDHRACDFDGDLLTDDAEMKIHFTEWQNPDTDGDGCADGEELLFTDPALGGLRDPKNPWDFYDVPVPTLGSGGTMGDRDGAISIVNDVLAVLEYSGTQENGPPNSVPRDYDDDIDGDTVKDGIAYDRSLGPMWSDAPDGAISIIGDVLLLLEQSGHSCQAPPP